MIFEYRIFQLPCSCDYKFMSFDFAMKYGLKHSDYVSVWAGDIEGKTIIDALEKVFYLHNSDDRPNRRGMHSLSVSDVVTLNKAPYYCDMLGWSEIPKEKWEE